LKAQFVAGIFSDCLPQAAFIVTLIINQIHAIIDTLAAITAKYGGNPGFILKAIILISWTHAMAVFSTAVTVRQFYSE